MIKKVIIIGPAHPFRSGGITTFNHRLAKQFIDEGYECTIYSFSLQYPSFLFPGKSQYSTEPAPENINILSRINSINPLNWLSVGNELRSLRPDLVVVRYWLPFMGPALGTILRKIRKNGYTKIVAITDNVLPHEARPGDRLFTKYFLKPCQAFMVMSEKVMRDLRQFEMNKPARLVPHPLYDNFGSKVSKVEARNRLGLNHQDRIILFFGFIRKYKGLDILLDAMNKLVKEKEPSNVKLLVAGEFYDDPQSYLNQIAGGGIKDSVILRTEFIPDQEVRYYFSAADLVVQPYRSATQSGVTPLAYHFEKPMVVTRVGGLPDLVPHEKVGLVCDPQFVSIARAIRRFYELGEDYFIPHLRTEKEKYSWHQFVNNIIELGNEIKPDPAK